MALMHAYKRRDYWRVALDQARWLFGLAQLAAWVGVLSGPGPVARWLSRRLGEVELALRSLLILKLAGRRLAPLRPRACKRGQGEALDDALAGDVIGPVRRRPRFSLRLDEFDPKSQQRPPFASSRGSASVCGRVRSRSADADEKVWETFSRRRTPEGLRAAGDGGTSAHSQPYPQQNPATDLFARFEAIASVFDDIDGHAARMGRRLAARGWRVRGFVVRPDNRFVPPAPKRPPVAPVCAPAILDSS